MATFFCIVQIDKHPLFSLYIGSGITDDTEVAENVLSAVKQQENIGMICIKAIKRSLNKQQSCETFVEIAMRNVIIKVL